MINPLNLISKFIRSSNQKELDKLQKIVTKINNNEKWVSELKNDEFPKKTEELKNKIKQGSKIDELLPEAFSLDCHSELLLTYQCILEIHLY